MSVGMDPDLFDEFAAIVQRDGMNVSSAIRAYVRAVVDGEVSVRPRFRNAAR